MTSAGIFQKLTESILEFAPENLKTLVKNTTGHCVKSVNIRSYSGPYFPAFGLNTERYGVSLRIQSECGKMGTRITPNTDTLHAVENEQYESKTVQNEAIKVVAEYTNEKTVSEVKESRYFTILAVEVNDFSNKEQMSLVLRHMNKRVRYQKALCYSCIVEKMHRGKHWKSLLQM